MIPKVSIIVPVYNVENYLDKCLKSLVSQSLQMIEILIVNDGSTDGSQKIIEEYEKNYPEKIKGFQKPNGGLSDARNYGLDRAKGEFIGFVDSDDYVESTMFEEMYHLAEKHHAEMAICNIQKVNEHGDVTQKLYQVPNLHERIVLKDHLSVFSDLAYFACNKIFRRSLFETHRFKKGVHFEDIQLIPQLLLECKVVAQTQNFHYQYLERADSITKTHNERGLDMLRAVEDVAAAFEKSQYRDGCVALKNFFIFEAVYSYLAYLAFVKDEVLYDKMDKAGKEFRKRYNVNLSEILAYRRFGQNYLLSLTLRKKIYYLLYFSGQTKLIKKLI